MIKKAIYSILTFIIIKVFKGKILYSSETVNNNWFLLELVSTESDSSEEDKYSKDGFYTKVIVAMGNKFTSFILPFHHMKLHTDFISSSGHDVKVGKAYRFSIFVGHVSFVWNRLDEPLDDIHNYNKKNGWSFSFFLPWTTSSRTKNHLYDTNKEFFRDLGIIDCLDLDSLEKYRLQEDWEKRQPKKVFICRDYDGEYFEATCSIIYSEFKTGYNKGILTPLLRIFTKTRKFFTLEMSFNTGIGDRKGSWKGGIIWTSIRMKSYEDLERAFKRYCENPYFRGSRESIDTNIQIIGDKNEIYKHFNLITDMKVVEYLVDLGESFVVETDITNGYQIVEYTNDDKQKLLEYIKKNIKDFKSVYRYSEEMKRTWVHRD